MNDEFRIHEDNKRKQDKGEKEDLNISNISIKFFQQIKFP